MTFERHRQLARDSASWIQTGMRLLASADVLWAATKEHFDAIEKVIEIGQSSHSSTGAFEIPADLDATIQEGSQHLTAFLLLAGYAIENFLKAVQVRSRELAGDPVVKETGELVGFSTTHNHLALGRDVFGKDNLSNMEQDILRRLSFVTTWSGRYPVPRTFPDPNDWLYASATSSGDYAEVHKLAERIIRLHDSLT